MKERLRRIAAAAPLDSPAWAAVPIVIAAFLCFFHLGFQSLWYDEWVTVVDATTRFRDIAVTVDAHPPLYFDIVRVFILVFGKSETALRLPSAIFGTLTIAAAYVFIRRRLGAGAAFWGSLLWAFLPFHVYYAHEARMYSLLPLEALLSMELWERAMEDGDIRHWIGFFLVTVAGLYTHYWYPYLVLSQGLWFLGDTLRRRGPLLPGAAAFLFAGFAFVPCLSLLAGQVFQAQLEQNRLPFLTHMTFVGQAFSGTYLGQPTWLYVRPFVVRTALVAWITLFVLGFFCWPEKMKATRLILVGFVFPMTFAWIAANTLRPAFNSRYFAMLLPPTFLIMAGAFSRSKPWVHPAAFILAALLLWADGPRLSATFFQPLKGPWRQLNHFVDQHGANTPTTALQWVDVPWQVRPPSPYYFAQRPIIKSLSELPPTANRLVLVGYRDGIERELRHLPEGWRVASRYDYAGSAAVIEAKY